MDQEEKQTLFELRWQAQFYDDLIEIEEADAEELPALLEKLLKNVKYGVCLETIIRDFKTPSEHPRKKSKYIQSPKEMEQDFLRKHGINILEKITIRPSSGRTYPRILLSRADIAEFNLSPNKQYMLWLVNYQPFSKVSTFVEFLEKLTQVFKELNEKTLNQSELIDKIEQIVDWMEELPSLESIIESQCNFYSNSKRPLSPEEISYLEQLGIIYLEQQSIQIPHGHNQARISLHPELLKQKGLKFETPYFLLIIPQKMQLNLREKHKEIIKAYNEVDNDEQEDFATFNQHFSLEQIVQMIDWKIDEYAEEHNFFLEPHYSAITIEEKIKERLNHFRAQMKADENAGLNWLYFRAFESGIYQRLECEKTKKILPVV